MLTNLCIFATIALFAAAIFFWVSSADQRRDLTFELHARPVRWLCFALFVGFTVCGFVSVVTDDDALTVKVFEWSLLNPVRSTLAGIGVLSWVVFATWLLVKGLSHQ